MFIIPNTTQRYTLFDNISDSNPSVLSATSSLQTFSYNLRPFQWDIGTADDWGRWGQQAMPRQLLVAPDSGTFFNPTFVVASGSITLPLAVQDATVGITIFQNSFGLVNGSVQVQSFPLRSANFLVTAGATVPWQIVTGAQNTFSGGPGFTKQIQLSVGVVLVFTTTSTPTVQMTQFEFQV